MNSRIIFLVSLCVLGLSSPAAGYVLKAYKWENGDFTYHVNTSSFGNVNGHSVSSAEGEFWTQYAVSQWTSRTGANLNVSYGGSTTASCLDDNDGLNTVEVRSGCHPNGCHVNGSVFAGNPGDDGTYYVERDLCIWGDANNWELQMASIASGEVDLVAVLVHEFGHMLGLGDVANPTPGGTMDGGYRGGGLQRYIYADDLAGIRAQYAGEGVQSLGGYWRAWDTSSDSWSARRSFGGTHFQPWKGDIGSYSNTGTDYVVMAQTDTDGDRIYFHRASYPLGTSPSWTTYSRNRESWVTPAITSNHDLSDGEFVAAWPEPTDVIDPGECGHIRFSKSTTAMSSGYTTTWSFCTLLSPALEWVDGSGRNYYLLVYVNFDFGTPSNTGEMMYATSDDGLYWSSPSSTGLYTLDTPGLACEYNGECQLAYVRASSDTSELVTRAITMSTSKTMSLGSFNTNGDRIEREPDIVYSYLDSVWLGTHHWTTNDDWLSRGWGTIYSVDSSSNPLPGSGYDSVESAEHPAKLVGNPWYWETYLFHID